jgi:hypothetical protein
MSTYELPADLIADLMFALREAEANLGCAVYHPSALHARACDCDRCTARRRVREVIERMTQTIGKTM